MKARPEDLRPPCFLSSKSRPQPPSQGRTQNTNALTALKTQTLEEEKDELQEREKVPQPALVSTTEAAEPDWKLHLEPAWSERSETPTSTVSHGSLSDFSRPPSSLFSRSTNLASGRSSVLSSGRSSVLSSGRSSVLSSGRSSVLSADIRDLDPEGSVCFSPLQPSPVMQSPLASSPPAESNPHQSTSTTTPPPCELLFSQTKPLSPRPTSSIRPRSDKPVSSRRSTKNLIQDTSIDPGLNPSLDSDHGLVTLAFPSTTWSSCPSPQRTTYRSGSVAKLTSSPPQLESHRWPVLPPISPVKVELPLTMKRGTVPAWPALSSEGLSAWHCDQEKRGHRRTEKAFSSSNSVVSNPLTPTTTLNLPEKTHPDSVRPSSSENDS
eukprot:superscaffoldBa00006787_g21887